MTTNLKRPRAKQREFAIYSQSVFQLVSEMEEPLREAVNLVHVISIANVSDGDLEAVGFVATAARARLNAISGTLKKLFVICRKFQD
jgi:hypothetical protein